MCRQSIYRMLRLRGVGDGGRCDLDIPEASVRIDAGPGCTARIVVAVVDDRPVALVFPASRRVVLDRVRKLFGADDAFLAPRDEVDRFLDDGPAGTSPSSRVPLAMALLLDATLLSARALEIRSCGEEGVVRLTLEDWLAMANPGLGFFTEPDQGADDGPSAVA
jgi:prolyl-tRNA editing enzyme YbaK/EbsC (Cys-tRNA(Pro) deacylase)